MSLYSYQIKKVPFVVNESRTLAPNESGTDILVSKQANYTITLPEPKKGMFFKFIQYDMQRPFTVTIDAGKPILSGTCSVYDGMHSEKLDKQYFKFTEDSHNGDYALFVSDIDKWCVYAFGFPSFSKQPFEFE